MTQPPRVIDTTAGTRSGPAVVIVESSPDTPLVWFDVAIRGGASADPLGVEGLHRHAGLLARRGAGSRDRTALDETLDSLGASIDVSVSRDAVTLSGLSLSRHLDAVIHLCADILAAPQLSEGEHARLLRETPQVLDEIRDDDSALATRWFDWVCSPGHPYGRTSLGTTKSLEHIDREAATELWRREVVANNVVIGLAGDIDDSVAAKIVQRLVERIPSGGRPRTYVEDIGDETDEISGRRLILVDKPDRTQAQIRIGHLALR